MLLKQYTTCSSSALGVPRHRSLVLSARLSRTRPRPRSFFSRLLPHFPRTKKLLQSNSSVRDFVVWGYLPLFPEKKYETPPGARVARGLRANETPTVQVIGTDCIPLSRTMSSQKRGSGQSKSLTLEELSANFHLPINDVARKVLFGALPRHYNPTLASLIISLFLVLTIVYVLLSRC